MNLELAGKAILITGGTDGLGLALATQLASEGAAVAVCGRDEERLRALAPALHERKGRHAANLRRLARQESRDDLARSVVANGRDPPEDVDEQGGRVLVAALELLESGAQHRKGLRADLAHHGDEPSAHLFVGRRLGARAVEDVRTPHSRREQEAARLARGWLTVEKIVRGGREHRRILERLEHAMRSAGARSVRGRAFLDDHREGAADAPHHVEPGAPGDDGERRFELGTQRGELGGVGRRREIGEPPHRVLH